MMASRSELAGLAALLLVARAAALRPPPSSLREPTTSICGFAHYGSAVGSAQRLVETHLAPGIADWNIVVPMPPPCADAQVTGVDMRVCDADAQPDVSMSDVRSARVHRSGSLAGFAAVNVTVYCILPPPTAPPPLPIQPLPPPSFPPPFSDPQTSASDSTDSSWTQDEMSNELKSFELSSNEDMSDESESIVSASIEQTTTVKPIPSTTTTVKPIPSTTTTVKPTSSTTTTVKPSSSTTLPPVPEETTAHVEFVLPTQVVTHPADLTKEENPQSIHLTINITPTNHMPTEDGESHPYDVELPLLSNIEKKNGVMPSHSPSFSSVPHIVTPPRFAEMPPQKHVRHPSQPGRPLHRPPPRALPLRPAPHAPGQPLYAQQYPSHTSFAAPSPPRYPLVSPYTVAPIYQPLSLLDPRLRFLQRRQPHIFFRHF